MQIVKVCLVAIWLSFALTAYSAEAPKPRSSVIAPLATRSLLLDVASSGEGIIVVGERGHILRSQDQGNSWRQITVPTRATLTAAAIHSDGLGFAVGHDATILRTLDGGTSWRPVYYAPEEERPLLDVYIIDPQHIIAVGAYGLYLESLDRGSSWVVRGLIARDYGENRAPESGEEPHPDEFHLNQFSVSDTGRWYIAAEAGNLYRSDDRGVSWIRLPPPYEGSFMGVLPMAGERVVVFGLQGKLYVSADGGESWRQMETGTQATLTNALVLQDGHVLVAGYSGSILTARQDLSEFRLTRLRQRGGISASIQLQSGELMFFGSGGMLEMPLSELKEFQRDPVSGQD